MTRRNFRTFVSGSAEISILASENNAPSDSFLPAFLTNTTGNKEIDELLLSLSGIIKDIDEKIDGMKLRNDGKTTISKVIPDCETIDISGGGVKIKAGSPLNPGELVFIRLDLYKYPDSLLESIGRVVRAGSKPALNGHQHYAGIEFINIDDEQREKLISYTFRQQRKYIRAFNTKKPIEQETELSVVENPRRSV